MEQERVVRCVAWAFVVAILVEGISRAQSPAALEWSGTVAVERGELQSNRVDLARTASEWAELWKPLAGEPPTPFDATKHIGIRIVVAGSPVDGRLLHVAAVREEEGSLVVHYTRHENNGVYVQSGSAADEATDQMASASHVPPPTVAYLVRLVPRTSLPIVAKAWENPFALLVSELARAHASTSLVEALQSVARGSTINPWGWTPDTRVLVGSLSSFLESTKIQEPTIRRYAMEGIALCGRDAYPASQVLLDALADPDEATRVAALDALGGLGDRLGPAVVQAFARSVDDPSCRVRLAALGALERTGPAALGAVDVLIAAVTNRSVCDTAGVPSRASSALVKCGDRAVHPILAALPDSDADARRLLVRTLGAIGPPAWESVPALMKELSNADVGVRREAARSIGLIGRAAKGAIDAVAKLLDDPDESVRREGVIALGQIGVARPVVLASLVAVAEDPKSAVRKEAVRALGGFGAEARGAVSMLVGLLADPLLRQDAVQALGRIGRDAAGAVPALTALLSSDAGNRRDVAIALGKIGPAARSVIPILGDLARREGAWETPDVIRALGQLGVESLPVLLELLRSGQASKQSIVAEAIGEIGLPARNALPQLLDALSSNEVRLAALTSIARVASDSSDVRMYVTRAVDSPFGRDVEFTRSIAVSSLAAAGVDVLPLLVDRLPNSNMFVRSFAAATIGRIGAKAKSAIPAMISALREESTFHEVAEAITWVLPGPGHSPSQRQQLRMMEDRDKDAAIHEAEAAVARIGSDILPLLVTSLTDASPAIRSFAARALGRIGAAARPAIPSLVAGLRDLRSRPAMMQALRDIGPEAAEALAQAMRGMDVQLKRAVVWGLGDLEKGAAFAMQALIEGLVDADVEVQNGVNETLLAIGSDAVPSLTSALRDSRRRIPAAHVLGLIGPWSAPAVEALTDLMFDPDPTPGGHAAIALREIGPAAAPVVAVLCERLKSPDVAVRRRAAHALGDLRDFAKSARPALEAALEDSDATVQRFAHDALWSIDNER
ncbi:MAG: HEAT repeat domain-containing protein [Planctomycetes bacterium]|nr:HEAT repeat domain-containing protein [Planctomycetota bacterium]MBI3847821.1 HEAT repeat domain-containing protein [Planctomycetota bacterium]